MSFHIILIKSCQVPRCATPEDRELITIPQGAVLEVISENAPCHITDDGFCIPFNSAIPVEIKKEE